MNIVGIGTDIVDIERMNSKIIKKEFVALVFTQEEIAYCEGFSNKAENYAARFAAKEAYMKALGTGWSDNANFKEIEVIKESQGAPRISLSGETKNHFEKSNLKDIFVSLSHTTKSAVAFVILTK